MKSLVGKASQTLNMQSLYGGTYDGAIQLVEQRYGRRDRILGACWDTLNTVEAVNNMSAEPLQQFHDTLTECLSCLEYFKVDLQDAQSGYLSALVKKLPKPLRTKWQEEFLTKKPTLREFMEWLQQRIYVVESCEEVSKKKETKPAAVNLATSTSYAQKAAGDGGQTSGDSASRGGGQSARGGRGGGRGRGRGRGGGASGGTSGGATGGAEQGFPRRPCALCSDASGHQLFRCGQFKSKSLAERKDYIQKQEICKICLRKNHTPDTCYNKDKLRCLVCNNFGHNTLLHE